MTSLDHVQGVEALLDALIAREGGFVDHPDDRGGPTRYGITEAVARSAGYSGAMSALPLALARDIYRRRYWQAPKFDHVAMRMPAAAAELFDTGVNMGLAVAAGFLQRALNVLNRGGRDWPDLAVDGEVGPRTLAALDGLAWHRGARGERVLVKALNALQGARYIALAEAQPSQESFVFGWLDQRL